MTPKGITTITFGNGNVVTPAELRHFATLNWAKTECKRLKTWFIYTINF